jgi:PAS domain S-box-containing protein
VTKSSSGRQPVLPDGILDRRELLSALFRSSTVGVAIYDRKFRFRAINDALASMNGLPAKAHLGKTLEAILGNASFVVQSAIRHVFATGEPVTDYEITAALPARSGVGRWMTSYFPLKNPSGEVQQAGAMVIELTKRKEIQTALSRLHKRLSLISSSLCNSSGTLNPSGHGGGCPDQVSWYTRSVELLETCLAETRAISQLLHADPLPLTASELKMVEAGPHDAGQRSSVAARTIEDEFSALSARERDVLALLANGKANKEIATILNISTRTVESHRARIMLKLDLHSVTDLVRYAVRSNLIQP